MSIAKSAAPPPPPTLSSLTAAQQPHEAAITVAAGGQRTSGMKPLPPEHCPVQRPFWTQFDVQLMGHGWLLTQGCVNLTVPFTVGHSLPPEQMHTEMPGVCEDCGLSVRACGWVYAQACKHAQRARHWTFSTTQPPCGCTPGTLGCAPQITTHRLLQPQRCSTPLAGVLHLPGGNTHTGTNTERFLLQPQSWADLCSPTAWQQRHAFICRPVQLLG